MKRQVIWFGAVAVTALLVALFVVAGSAVAQVEGVNNEAETCVGESCNSGNVADVEVEGGGLGVFLNVGVITGDNSLVVNDAFNTSVTITQTQEGGPAAPISIPGMASVGGVNNEAETCVGGSCNSGNVAEVKVENGLSIGLGLPLIGDLLGIAGEGEFDAAQLDGLLEINLPCTIIAANVGIGVIVGDNDTTINDVCNTDVTVDQSQKFGEKKEAKVVEEVKAQQVAAAKGAALPVTGAMILTLGLLGSGLSTAGLAFWRRGR